MSQNDIDKLKKKVDAVLKNEVSQLSGLKRILFDGVLSYLMNILSDDCSEKDIALALNSLSKVNSEYIREDDYLNYDKAMKMLCFSANRAGFSTLMKKNGIQQHTFKNQKIGFKKSEILALIAELEEKGEMKKPKIKIKNEKYPGKYVKKESFNNRPLSRIEKLY